MATKRLKTNGTAYNEAVMKQLEGLMVVLEQNIDDQALEIEELGVELEALSQKVAALENKIHCPSYTSWSDSSFNHPANYGTLYAPALPVLPSWYKRMLKKVGL